MAPRGRGLGAIEACVKQPQPRDRNTRCPYTYAVLYYTLQYPFTALVCFTRNICVCQFCAFVREPRARAPSNFPQCADTDSLLVLEYCIKLSKSPRNDCNMKSDGNHRTPARARGAGSLYLRYLRFHAFVCEYISPRPAAPCRVPTLRGGVDGNKVFIHTNWLLCVYFLSRGAGVDKM